MSEIRPILTEYIGGIAREALIIQQEADRLVDLGLNDAFEKQLASYGDAIHQPSLYYELTTRIASGVPIATLMHPLFHGKQVVLKGQNRFEAGPKISIVLERPSAVVIDFKDRSRKSQAIERRFVDMTKNGHLIFASSVERRRPDVRLQTAPRMEFTRLMSFEQSPENIERALIELFPDGGFMQTAMLE